MDNLNSSLFSLYEAAQNATLKEFSDYVFPWMQTHLQFESAGICDFSQTQNQTTNLASNLTTKLATPSSIKLNSALAFEIDAAEKLKTRQELIANESMKQNNLISDDPALARAFLLNGRTVNFAATTALPSNLYAYAKKTRAMNVLTMVIRDRSEQNFKTISLWRGSARDRYENKDEFSANLILPHALQALSINRRIHSSSTNSLNEASAIADASGILISCDPNAVTLMEKEFPDWSPPFLPKPLFNAVKNHEARRYLGKFLNVSAQRQHQLILLTFHEKPNSEKLSPTEFVIADMLIRNESYKEIAQKLGSQPATVRNHAHNIYVKFAVSGKAALAKAMQTK